MNIFFFFFFFFTREIKLLVNKGPTDMINNQ
jgi:hypothetical protein